MFYWLNGEYFEENEFSIDPFNQDILNRLEFLETFRTYKGNVVLFQEYFNRLCMFLNHHRRNMPYTIIQLQEVIRELTNRAGETDGVIHLIAFISIKEKEIHTVNELNLLLVREELSHRIRGTEKEATWIQLPGDLSVQESRYKMYPYNNKYKKDELHIFEHFLVSPNGFVTNGVKSTIFWAKDDIIYTPSFKTGELPDITRQWLIVKAKQFGYQVIENIFFKSDLENAHECFVTNSIEELVPISSIGNVKFIGEIGPIYQLFHQAYIEEIIQTMKRSVF